MRCRALAVVLVLLAGCGGGDGGDDEVHAAAVRRSTTTSTSSTTSPPSTIAAPSTSTSGAAATTTAPATTTTAAVSTTAAPPPTTTTTTTAPAPSEVAVTARGFAFSPRTPSAAAGEIAFTATNEDGAAHTFTIEGTDVDIALPPNGSGSDSATLVAGTYEFVCRLHASMTGTLTVS